MRDPQEYDVTDLLYEWADDFCSAEGFAEWWQDNCDEGIDWDRVEDCVAWSGSVMVQWFEYVCGRTLNRNDYLFIEARDYAFDQARRTKLGSTIAALLEADNYGYMDDMQSAENTIDMILMLAAEEILQ